MKQFLIVISLCLLGFGSFFSYVMADPDDYEGSKDHPHFNRMPGYVINEYEEKEFDNVKFKIGAEKTTQIEGKYYYLRYCIKDDAKSASPVRIVRNYTNAVRNSGGQVVYSFSDEATFKIVNKTAETWVYVGVSNNGDMYELMIVEKQLMQQDIVANAASLAQTIKNKGRVEIYGIYFDTGKSAVKADSEPALKQIAKLLQDSPNLKLYVVGHTDNVGGIDSNLKLSRERAEAVVKALVSQYSINASRLQAFGVGPLAPVESNQTEEGRAKNRRVELVAQ